MGRAPLRILLVEDNPGDARLLQELLVQTWSVPFEFDHAPDLTTALGKVETEEYSVALLDLDLPESRGLETLRRTLEVAPRLPVVVLTGLDDEATGDAAVKMGAQDYIVKGQVPGDLLLRLLRHAIERKHASERQEFSARVLAVLNESPEGRESLERILGIVKEFTGFEAVAIRIRRGDDYPYFATRGFPQDFVDAERYLCALDGRGEPMYDDEGKPILSCVCGSVLLGYINPQGAHFSPGGSFWTSGMGELMATIDHDTLGRHVRNRCGEYGYESVALLPLKSGTEMVGLLQLNDHRPGLLDDDTVQFLEGIGASIGIALARVRSEQQLAVSEERHRLLLEHSGIGIGYYDLEGRVILFNGIAALHMGGRPEEFVGRTMHELYGEAAIEYMQRVHRVVAADEAHEYEDFSSLPTGEKWFHSTYTKVLDAAGRVIGVQILSRDVTEKKKAEVKLREQEQQIRQSQKLEAIGSLAGGVAHDFNNLLSVISGYTDLLLETLEQGDPARDNLLEVRAASRRASELTRQLLAFSRKQVLEPRLIDLNELVTGMEKMLRRLLGEDLDLATHPDLSIGRIKADPGQIEQVIMNLVVNAREAMPGGGQLTLETAEAKLDEDYCRKRPGTRPGTYVMMAVTDTGEGMSEEVRSRIFEPFFTTRDQGKGTGLGLSTVYGIVKQSGGDIRVYSEPGRGTTFKIYLPRHEGPADAMPERRAVPERLRGEETILVVEDEDTLRRLVARILKRHGYEVLAASNGGEALLICEQREGAIHLMLTDVVMPQMSGPELADRLRDVVPDMRVLFMSGYTDNAMVHQGLIDRDVQFLQKPFTAEAVATKVRSVLDT